MDIHEKPLQESVQEMAKGAVEYAKQYYQIDLDFSEESIERIEDVLAKEHESRAGCVISLLYLVFFRSKKREHWNYAFLFGAYVGEVLRRKHGGGWIPDEEIMPGMMIPALQKDDQIIWPAGKVFKRLQNGPEDNVHHYYQAIVRDWQTESESN